jgi:hypothetical protein
MVLCRDEASRRPASAVACDHRGAASRRLRSIDASSCELDRRAEACPACDKSRRWSKRSRRSVRIRSPSPQHARQRVEPPKTAALSLTDGGGLASGDTRRTHSPSTRKGSRLVARICTPRAPLKIAAARAAVASITCPQLSSRRSIRLSLIAATKPGSGSSDRISRLRAEANAVGTRRGSATGARSINQAACS